MKAIALGAFGARATRFPPLPPRPLNATTIGSAEVSNVDQVRLVCNEYGRCWRTRGLRYVQRYYEDDPSYVVGRGYNYYRWPPATTIADTATTADRGSAFAAGSQEAKGPLSGAAPFQNKKPPGQMANHPHLVARREAPLGLQRCGISLYKVCVASDLKPRYRHTIFEFCTAVLLRVYGRVIGTHSSTSAIRHAGDFGTDPRCSEP